METTVYPKLSRAMWFVLVLLAISVVINYVDRANLSIVVSSLREEMHISASRLGVLLSAFFWTYLVMTAVSGFLIDRFPVSIVLTVGFVVWSLATAATGFAYSLGALLLARLIVGAGASVALPSYSKIFATFLPEHHRGLANSFIAAGCAIGPALVGFGGIPLVQKFGWRSCFVVCGLLSLFWLIPWLRWMPKGAGITSRSQHGKPSTLQIIGQRSAWGTFVGLFCSQYYSYFLITWLPYYLARDRHFSNETIATVVGGVFLGLASSSIIAGLLSDRWIQHGGTPTCVRKTMTGGGLALASVIGFVPMASSRSILIALLAAACISFGFYYSNAWAVTQTLAGPEAVGRWSGLKNLFGNLSGVIAPLLTGCLVERYGTFTAAFHIVAGLSLAGAAAWVFLVASIKKIDWNTNVS
ncbi:MAG: MFS transporter [Terriglobales bacterium]|jgi:MFS family permease